MKKKDISDTPTLSRFIRIAGRNLELKVIDNKTKIAIDLSSGKEYEWEESNDRFLFISYDNEIKKSILNIINGKGLEDVTTKQDIFELRYMKDFKQVTGNEPFAENVKQAYDRYLDSQIIIRDHVSTDEYVNYINFDQIYFFERMDNRTFIQTKFMNFETY